MNKTIYEEAIMSQTNAERWQAELIAELSIMFGDTLERSLEIAEDMFGKRADA